MDNRALRARITLLGGVSWWSAAV